MEVRNLQVEGNDRRRNATEHCESCARLRSQGPQVAKVAKGDAPRTAMTLTPRSWCVPCRFRLPSRWPLLVRSPSLSDPSTCPETSTCLPVALHALNQAAQIPRRRLRRPAHLHHINNPTMRLDTPWIYIKLATQRRQREDTEPRGAWFDPNTAPKYSCP